MTISYSLNKSLSESYYKRYVKANELVKYLIAKGWKTSKPVEETSVSDLFTVKHIVVGARMDLNEVHLDCIPNSI